MNAPFLDPKTADKKRRYARFRAALTRWHRRAGVTAAILVLLLSVTGILLSHAEAFRLHERTLSPTASGLFYGEPQNSRPVGIQLSGAWLIWIDSTLYLGDTLLTQRVDELRGAVETDDLLVLAGAQEILLFTRDGTFVEKLNGALLPGAPDRIAKLADSTITLETGSKQFTTTPDFLEWKETDIADPSVAWSAPTQALPKAVGDASLSRHGVSEVSLHRFISDLHSGRTFGPWGPFIMDLAAILLIILSLSGLYMWWRQRRARGQAKRLMPPAE